VFIHQKASAWVGEGDLEDWVDHSRLWELKHTSLKIGSRWCLMQGKGVRCSKVLMVLFRVLYRVYDWDLIINICLILA
jgi:hypothetical protein